MRTPLITARLAAFAGGCAAIAIALWSPLDAAASRRLSDHMAQHLLLTCVAPLLLAAAAPVRLALLALTPRGRRVVGRALHLPVTRAVAQPAVATALVVAATLLLHLPGAIDLAERSATFHVLEHALLFWSALLLWIVVVAVDPVPHAPSPMARLAWLTGAMVAMTVVGAVYSSATHPLVAAYAQQSDALADQQAAGAVMWVGSGAILVPAILAVVFAAMVREEALQRRREAAGR